MVDGEIKQ